MDRRDTEMVPELPRRRHRHIGRTVCCLVGILCISLAARSQDTEQQLQQLKQQLTAFEQRISVLEQQLEKEKEAKGQKSVSGEQAQGTPQAAKPSVVQISEKFPKSG